MNIEVFSPGEFDAARHYYPRSLNAQIHPLVSSFMHMSTGRVISRYCHLHPHTDREALAQVLMTPPRYLYWSGSDIFNVSTDEGVKQKYIIETNTCPSGQKSYPMLDEDQEEGGYRRLLERTFLPLMAKALKKATPDGVLAVLYDKNPMEASGYAQVLANLTIRPVWLVPMHLSKPLEFVEVIDRQLFIRDGITFRPITCAFRYVTQKPWTRLPINLKTPILNPIVACLAGGRNKTAAAKAYEQFNGRHRHQGLEILTPESFTNVRKAEVPLRVNQLGGKAVVKVPYLNAGQGIYTVVNERELKEFMDIEHDYDEFIVQQLVGNFQWSSTTGRGKVFNIGTVPDKKEKIYIFDLRMMISWQEDSFRPVAMYSRRAPVPMETELEEEAASWSVLGTNLSKKVGVDAWETEPERLLMMDRRDFSRLGLGIDDLIEAFVQSVMATQAIDDLSQQLMKRGGGFRRDLFRSLNNDETLLNELCEGPTQ